MSAVRRNPSLVPIILRSRWRMVLNTAFKQGRETRGWTTIFIILGLAAVVFSYRAAGVIFCVDTGSTGNTIGGTFFCPSGQFPAHPQVGAVAGALTMLSGFVGVTSITFALSSLYFAKDIDTLLSSPLNPRVVVLSRMLTQLGLGIGLGLVLAGPPLLAYLVAVGQLQAAPLIAISVVGLVLTPLAVATGFVIFGLRAIPARYVRDAGGLIVTVAIFGVAAINLALRGPDAFTSARPSLEGLPFDRIGAGIAGSQWSPTGWAARAVVAAVNGDVPRSLLWCAPLIGVGVVLVVMVARWGETSFVVGYHRNAVATRGKQQRPPSQKAQHSSRQTAPPPWLLIAIKDLREIRRDPSQMSQLALPLVLFGLYLGTPGRGPTGTGALPAWFLVSLTSCFAALLFAANIALRGVGVEGQRLWVIKVSPVDSRQLLAAKYASGFLVAFLPATALFWIGEFRNHAGVLDVLLSTGRLALLVATVVSLAVGLGAMRPRLEWTDPRRAVGIGITLFYLGAGALYLTIAFILLGLPYAFADSGDAVPVLLAHVVLLVASTLLATATMWGGARRLKTLEM